MRGKSNMRKRAEEQGREGGSATFLLLCVDGEEVEEGFDQILSRPATKTAIGHQDHLSLLRGPRTQGGRGGRGGGSGGGRGR